MKMTQVNDLSKPTLSSILFFSARRISITTSAEPCVDLGFPQRLSLTTELENPDERRFRGQTSDGIQVEVGWRLAHDTHILRLTLSLERMYDTNDWLRLKNFYRELLDQTWKLPQNPRPWGETVLYSADILTEKPSLKPHLTALELSDTDTQLEATPFGYLSLVREDAGALPDGHAYWHRELVLFTPQSRSERVNSVFLDPLTQGFSRIELYLHKAKHHARQETLIREHLEKARESLQDGMSQALRTVDLSQVHQEQEELELISQRLMRFLSQKATVEVLLNSLRNNQKALVEHLERVRLESNHYQGEIKHIQRLIEQLESDISNARVVLESTYSFQEIQRGIEANRLERAGVLMSATAALLAGVAIFNSFLDIWNLSLEGSNLERPPSWLRIFLGFIAGVSLPLAATWGVVRQKKRAVVALIFGLLAILAAIAATVWVNA